MRPDRDEMLAGVRRALVEFVGPEVSSVYARTEVTYAISLLSAIARESEDAVASLVGENAELRTLLRQAGRALIRSSLDEALLRELAAVQLPPRRPDLRLSALRDESAGLFDLFIRLQASCEGCQGDARVRSVYRKTLAFLRRRANSAANAVRR